MILQELLSLLTGVTQCMQFCIDWQLLPSKDVKDCLECGAVGKVLWGKKKRNKNFPHCLRCRVCRKEWTIVHNTWFSKAKLDVRQNLLLVYMWAMDTTMEVAALQAKVSLPTAIDYFTFCREVCRVVVTNDVTAIGGADHIVEIDEIHVCTRKYFQGHLLEDEFDKVWVFGGIDRRTKECFMVRVKKRDAATLVPIIKKFIRPGTKIYSDGWKAYRDLESEGFIHGVVNNSIEFVSQDDASIHTQTVERLWKSLKENIKSEGRPSPNDELYLFQFIYLYKLRLTGHGTHDLVFEQFLRDIVKVYPGYGKEGLEPKEYGELGAMNCEGAEFQSK